MASLLDTDPQSSGDGSGVLDGLASLYRRLTAPPEVKPIWDPSNPTGTETTVSMGMPRDTTYAGPIGEFVNPATGQLTARGVDRANAPQMNFDTGGVGLLGTIKAYHGSPHLFEPTARNPLGEFDPARIGTGEGAQAYGVGAGYLAEREGIARDYRDKLASKDFTTTAGDKIPDWIGNSILRVQDDPNLLRGVINGHVQDFQGRIAEAQARLAQGTDPQPWMIKDNIIGLQNIVDGLGRLRSGEATLQPRGHMYEVNVDAEPEHFLHWDKPLSEQSQFVRDALEKVTETYRPAAFPLKDVVETNRLAQQPGGPVHLIRDEPHTWDPTGGDIVQDLGRQFGRTPEAATAALQSAGIPGIRYLDASSRSAGEGTHNLVVFSPQIMDIVRRYGIGGLTAGGGASLLYPSSEQQPQGAQQ